MARRTYLLSLLLILGPLLPGCAKDALMKTPAVIATGVVNPYEELAPELQTNQASVFVAAPRELAENPRTPGQTYTNERSPVIRLGRAEVEIGAGITWEELVAASLATKRQKNPEVVLTSFEDYGTLWNSHPTPGYSFSRHHDFADIDRAASDRWIDEINRQLEGSQRKQIYIYVHGFNTRFDKNTRLCAEFWHYMARDGVMVSFDWPSRANLFSYQQDKANSEAAIRQFRNLLEFFADESHAERINIIAHSAGSRVVVETLRDLSLRHYDLSDEQAQATTKIGRVVLAAPDMDFGVALSAGIDGIERIAEGIIVYASRADKALGISGDIFGDVRLGNVIGKLPPSIVEEMNRSDSSGWIDATPAQKRYPSLLGHSYYHQNPLVSSDILIYLFVGATAEERGLVRDHETGFLTFPPDYEENLPARVEAIVEKYDQRDRSGG